LLQIISTFLQKKVVIKRWAVQDDKPVGKQELEHAVATGKSSLPFQ
jgi:hypothetical protein